MMILRLVLGLASFALLHGVLFAPRIPAQAAVRLRRELNRR
jgi:hypothetical protein